MPVAASNTAPAALTATSAATVVPSGRTVLADPIPPATPPAAAPVPAPTRALDDPAGRPAPCRLPPRQPGRSWRSGRCRKSPPRPRSNSTAAGTMGTTPVRVVTDRGSRCPAPRASASPRRPRPGRRRCRRSGTRRGRGATRFARIEGVGLPGAGPAAADVDRRRRCPVAGGPPSSRSATPGRCGDAWPTRRPSTSVRSLRGPTSAPRPAWPSAARHQRSALVRKRRAASR